MIRLSDLRGEAVEYYSKRDLKVWNRTDGRDAGRSNVFQVLLQPPIRDSSNPQTGRIDLRLIVGYHWLMLNKRISDVPLLLLVHNAACDYVQIADNENKTTPLFCYQLCPRKVCTCSEDPTSTYTNVIYLFLYLS